MNKRIWANTMAILCGCSMAANASSLVVGQANGLSTFEHDGSAYTNGAFSGIDPAIVDIAVVPGGMHVMSSTGLTYYDYDPVTDVFTRGGNFSWGSETGTCVAVAADGTVFAGGSSGFGPFTYTGSGYTSDAWFVNDTKDIAIDSNGHIHVCQSDGLSGWTYSAGALTLTAWDAGWPGGTIAIDSSNVLHVGKADGIGDVICSGTNYVWGGHWAGTPSGINAVEIDEANGQIWAGQGDGVQVVDASDYALLAYSAFAGGIDAVCVDVVGEVHLGKSDGMMSVDIIGSSVIYDGTSWYAMTDVKAIEETVANPIPPIPEIGDITLVQLPGTNGLALTWFTGVDTYQYTLLGKDNLVIGNWTTNMTVSGVEGDLTVTTAVDQAQSFYHVIGE